MTAIERGQSKACTAAAAASSSRCSNRSRASGVSDVEISARTTPGSRRIRTGSPLSRKTSSLGPFSGSTSASQGRDPRGLGDLRQEP
jgi:hypothetical protein